MRKEGEGRLYYDTVLSYEPAQMNGDSINAGIEIHREYSVERDGKWVLGQNPLQVKTGDLVRVDLFVSLPSERYFVVVEDPVPGGLEPVNRELATSSEVDAQKGESAFAPESLRSRYTDWKSFGISRWSFYHKELRHDSARFYSERLGAGHYYLSYTAQAIAPGEFTALPARAEQMYEPDVYGKSSPSSAESGTLRMSGVQGQTAADRQLFIARTKRVAGWVKRAAKPNASCWDERCRGAQFKGSCPNALSLQ